MWCFWRLGKRSVVAIKTKFLPSPRLLAFLPLVFLLIDYGSTAVALNLTVVTDTYTSGFIEKNPQNLEPLRMAIFFSFALTSGLITWFMKSYADATGNSKLLVAASILGIFMCLVFARNLVAGLSNTFKILKFVEVLH